MSNYTKQRRDLNEPEIIEVFESAGAWCQQMDRTAGFDLLVHGLTCFPIVVEVKQQRAELTEHEKEVKEKIDKTIHGLYCVIRFPHQAQAIVTVIKEQYAIEIIKRELYLMELE